MLKKKGDYKWDVMFSLIVGLLVVGIIMWWLFQEYFTKDDIDWEVCRESLIVRNSLPEKDLVAGYVSTKSTLPLKCGTRTIDIDYEDTAKAEEEIANTIASCWYMVGKGEYKVFPASSLLKNPFDEVKNT